MASEKTLSRSSLEAYGAVIVTVITVALPMTWWLCILLVFVVCALAADVCFRAGWFVDWPVYQKQAFAFLVCLLIVTGGGFRAYSLSPLYQEVQASQEQKRASVKSFRNVFDTDFLDFGSLGNEEEIYEKSTNKLIAVVPTRLHYDYGSGSKFLSIFLPPGDMDTDFYVCMFYTKHIQDAIKMDDNGGLKFFIQRHQAGDSDSLSTDKFAFSNLIYIYALPEMTLENKAKVVAAFKENGITAIFRGIEYYSHNQS